MRTIEVAEDVYDHLLRSSTRIGEDATSILRRLLQLPEGNGAPTVPPTEEHAPSASAALRAFITSPAFRAKRNVTERYLSVLSFAHQEDPESFERVLNLNGRRRAYFARTREEIAASGKSVHPRQIPGSPYWAMTNASSANKKSILRSVLKLLGYTNEVTRAAAAALD